MEGCVRSLQVRLHALSRSLLGGGVGVGVGVRVEGEGVG